MKNKQKADSGEAHLAAFAKHLPLKRKQRARQKIARLNAKVTRLSAELKARTRALLTAQDKHRREISGCRQVERSLIESEARLRTLIQAIPDHVWLKDENGVFLFCSPMTERFFGARETDIIGKTDYDFVDRKLADFFREHDRKAMAAGKPTCNEEWLTFADDGHRALVETIKTPMFDAEGKLIGVLGIARDITERKRAEETLSKAMKFSRTVMNSINDAISVIDVGDYRIMGCNTVFLKQAGLAEADALGKYCYELTHRVTEPCPPSHDTCPMVQTVLTGKYSAAEHRHFTGSGEKMFVEVSTSPIFDENGNVAQVVHVSRNITERKRIEEKLRVSAEQWQLTFDAISDGVSIHDNEMTIVRANKSLGEFLGTPSEDLLGRKCHKVFHNSDEPHPDCPLRRAMNSQKPEFSEFLEPFLNRWLSISCFPIFEAAGKEIAGTVHIARDITDRKRTEDDIRRLNEELELKVEERTKQLLDSQEALVRKEKLAALGQIVGCVGHELRHPLGVMSNAVYYLQTVLAGSDDTVREYLGIIKNEIFGAERIVSDLLDAVRTKPPRPQFVSAEEVIRMGLEKCRIPENITVDIQAETQRPVSVDPLQMKQVFVNLINNAVEAMPEGGALKIRARLMKDEGLTRDEGRGVNEGRRTSDEGRKDISSIEFSVADTGRGITPDVRAKLFQPLFTTKTRGIGLGLVVVKNLAEANGGKIDVSSEVGKGTRFTVILPCAAARNEQNELNRGV